jgi:hypothetical protein
MTKAGRKANKEITLKAHLTKLIHFKVALHQLYFLVNRHIRPQGVENRASRPLSRT